MVASYNWIFIFPDKHHVLVLFQGELKVKYNFDVITLHVSNSSVSD